MPVATPTTFAPEAPPAETTPADSPLHLGPGPAKKRMLIIVNPYATTVSERAHVEGEILATATGEPDQTVRLARAHLLARALSFPTGVGLDVPHWILRLEGEVQRVRTSKTALVSLAETPAERDRGLELLARRGT